MYQFIPTPKSFDHRAANPHVEPFLNLLRAKDWSGVSDYYAALTPSERHHTIFSSAYLLPSDEFDSLGDVHDLELLIVIGGVKAVWAIRMRGFAHAHETSKEQWESSQVSALQALDMLEKAIAIDANDTTIYGFYIHAHMLAPEYRDSDLGPEAYEGLRNVSLDAVANAASLMKKSSGSLNIFAAHALVSFDAPKWYGSFGQMEATVKEFYDYLPLSSACAIEAFSIYEEWLWYVKFEENREVRRNYIDNLDSMAHINRLKNLSQAFWEGAKGRDPNSIDMIYGYNQFSNLYCCHHFHDMARKHLKAMGKNILFHPWGATFEGGGCQEINKHRMKSYLLPLWY